MIDNLTLIATAAARAAFLAAEGIALVALIAGLALLTYVTVRFLAVRHRAGIARLAAADARRTDPARRARTAARTIIDADTGAVTVERHRRTV